MLTLFQRSKYALGDIFIAFKLISFGGEVRAFKECIYCSHKH